MPRVSTPCDFPFSNTQRALQMEDVSRTAMADKESEAIDDDANLHDQLKSMEAKLSRLRDARQQHNDAGKRSADKRNSVQKEYNILRESINEKLAENKKIRVRAKAHQARRDAIQEQIRELIGQARDSRSGKGKKSPIVELAELTAQIEKLETMLETTPMKIEKENKNEVLKVLNWFEQGKSGPESKSFSFMGCLQNFG